MFIISKRFEEYAMDVIMYVNNGEFAVEFGVELVSRKVALNSARNRGSLGELRPGREKGRLGFSQLSAWPKSFGKPKNWWARRNSTQMALLRHGTYINFPFLALGPFVGRRQRRPASFSLLLPPLPLLLFFSSSPSFTRRRARSNALDKGRGLRFTKGEGGWGRKKEGKKGNAAPG